MALIQGDNGPNPDLDGTEEADEIYGYGGNDFISGRGGVDFMNGGSGVDRIDYSYSAGGWRIDIEDQLATSLDGSAIESILNFEDAFGGQGNDDISGSGGANRLLGGLGADYIHGASGNDVVDGGAGQDQLFGDAGIDVLIGGAGSDRLDGGLDRDRFVISGSGVDVILDFFGAGNVNGSQSSQEDRIDLRGIDAVAASSGDNDFIFRGALTDAQGLAFGAGSLWVHTNPANDETRVHGNTDADSTIELTVVIADSSVTAGDYNEGDFML